MTQSVILCQQARNASRPSGRLCMSSLGESSRNESYAATDGLRIPFMVWTRVQSSPSNNAANSTGESLAGIPDQYLQAVAALGAIDDHRAGERILGQHLLRQGGEKCAPLRKSIGRVASNTRAPAGILIMIWRLMRAPRATPRSIEQHHPCRTRPAPPHRQV
jgi:hypothetical protein